LSTAYTGRPWVLLVQLFRVEETAESELRKCFKGGDLCLIDGRIGG